MPREKENEIKVVNIRLVREPSFYGDEPVSSPDDALRVVANELKRYDREVFEDKRQTDQSEYLQRRDTGRIPCESKGGIQKLYPLQCGEFYRYS